jgi:superfamily II DNA or RNA helicase
MKLIVSKNKLKILGLPGWLREEIREELSYTVKGAWFTDAFKSYDWDGKKSFIRKVGRKAITEAGFLERIIRIIKRHKKYRKKIKIIDRRTYPEADEKEMIKALDLLKKRPFQQDVVVDCVRIGHGMIHVGVGGGKTWIMAALCIAYPDKKILITVPNMQLVKKTITDLKEKIDEPIGQIGGGKWKEERITVSTYQSIFPRRPPKKKGARKRRDVPLVWKPDAVRLARETDILLDDECHHALSESHKLFLRKMKTQCKFGFSGTIDLTGEGLLLEGLFGREIADYSLRWLIDNGYCAEPRVKWNVYPATLTEGHEYVISEEDREEGKRSAYEIGVVRNKNRNKLFVKDAKALLKRGHIILTLVRLKKHGRKLLRKLQKVGVPAEYIDGSMNKDITTDAAERLNDGKLRMLISTPLFDEGVDIPNVTALFMSVGEKSARLQEQRTGRLLRAIGPKTTAIIIDGMDAGNEYTRKHSKRRLKWYKKMGFVIMKYDYRIKGSKKLAKKPKITRIN